MSALLALAAPGCSEPDRPPDFARDIAPILHANCSTCHRPGENAPFALLSYEDARRRSRQIADVVESGFMPPWPPARGVHAFLGERGLSDLEVATIRRWADEGAVEGDPAATPEVPTFSTGWLLGEPDLVVEMPEPYSLSAGGEDVYRNFVIRSPVDSTHHVRAIEFLPGNNSVVHHAFMLVDASDGSRRQDASDPLPGFDGIHPPETATMPAGFFLSWTPGRLPFGGVDGMSWPLEAGTDIVIQLHMQPSGKPEEVRSRVGLHFDDSPPTKVPYTVGLFSKDLDIPPGDASYLVAVDYRMPVDVDVLGALPHAHFLGKSMEAHATLPDGKRIELIELPEWDFNWQDAYRYVDPVFLPRGSEVHLRFTYDNSAANPRNPHVPPERVTYGLQSVDEMCELWLQVLPRDPADLEPLRRDQGKIMMNQVLQDAQRALAESPDDAQAHLRLAQAMLGRGELDDAERELERARSLDPTAAEAYLLLSMIHRRRGRQEEAARELERGIGVRPGDARLHFALGSLFYDGGALDRALPSYQQAVRLDPDHFRANLQLGVTLARSRRVAEAIQCFERCVALRPDDPDARRNLLQARSMLERRPR